MRLILPSQRTKVKTKFNCSGVRLPNWPEMKWPSMVVSHAEQCKRVTDNSASQTGQRVGAGLMKTLRFQKLYLYSISTMCRFFMEFCVICLRHGILYTKFLSTCDHPVAEKGQAPVEQIPAACGFV